MSIIKYPEVNWSIPALFSRDEYILSVSNVMERLGLKNPITSAYGMVPSVWTGERLSEKRTQQKDKIESLLYKIIEKGIIPEFTLNSLNIKQEDLSDEFCNWLLDFGVEHGCGFIIASDLLYEYIKSRYQNAKCIASRFYTLSELTKGEKSEIEIYNLLLDKFDKVEVRAEYVKDKLLKGEVELSDVSRIEITVNNLCIPNCSIALQEAIEVSLIDYKQYIGDDEVNELKCLKNKIIESGNYNQLLSDSLLLDNKEIDKLVNNYGIKNLRLSSDYYTYITFIRVMNNYLFNNIGEFQNVSPLIWGTCENIIQRGLVKI